MQFAIKSAILFSFIFPSSGMEIFIEKNDYIKQIGQRRCRSKIETHAINYANNFAGNQIANHVYDGQVKRETEELMLYAYSSYRGVYIYTVHQLNAKYNKTGTIKRFTDKTMALPEGFRLNIKNKKNLDRKLFKEGFDILSVNTNKIRHEILSEEAEARRLRWENRHWGWKVADGLWKIFVAYILIGRFYF